MEYIVDLLTNLHWAAVGQIILIDILLGGDNAIVIALACRNLPPELRNKGIFWGTTGAILLRILLVSLAVLILDLPFLRFVGGLLLLWIGMKLLVPEAESDEEVKGSTQLWGAVKTIIVADFIMSLDNVIGISGAVMGAHEDHQTILIIFGILVAVPFIVFGSQVILKIIERFPIIVYFGAGLLGWIGGSMIISDNYLVKHVPGIVDDWHYPASIICAVIVIVVGALWGKSRRGA